MLFLIDTALNLEIFSASQLFSVHFHFLLR